MSKTAITSPELAPPVVPFFQAAKSMVSSSSADRSPKTRLQSALSCPHGDRGCRATTRGLRRDRSRRQGLRRRKEGFIAWILEVSKCKY